MRTKKFAAIIASITAMLLLGAVCFASPAQAYIETDDGVYLLGQGGETYNNDNWRAYVSIPQYLALSDDYWNFTVYLEYINLSGSGQSYDPGFSVVIYIDDGALNYSASTGTITESRTSIVYSNISLDSSKISLFSANDSATLTVQLVNNSVANDTYVTTIPIYKSSTLGLITGIIPAILSLVILAIVINYIGDITKKMNKVSRKGRKR